MFKTPPNDIAMLLHISIICNSAVLKSPDSFFLILEHDYRINVGFELHPCAPFWGTKSKIHCTWRLMEKEPPYKRKTTTNLAFVLALQYFILWYINYLLATKTTLKRKVVMPIFFAKTKQATRQLCAKISLSQSRTGFVDVFHNNKGYPSLLGVIITSLGD